MTKYYELNYVAVSNDTKIKPLWTTNLPTLLFIEPQMKAQL